MSRKNILEAYKMFDAVDLSVASSTSNVVNVKNQDKASIILEWTGTSPVGVIDVQVRNRKEPSITTNWESLDMGGTINITGNSGSHILRFDEIPFSEIRLVYTKTSGIGNLTAIITAKQTGG